VCPCVYVCIGARLTYTCACCCSAQADRAPPCDPGCDHRAALYTEGGALGPGVQSVLMKDGYRIETRANGVSGGGGAGAGTAGGGSAPPRLARARRDAEGRHPRRRRARPTSAPRCTTSRRRSEDAAARLGEAKAAAAQADAAVAPLTAERCGRGGGAGVRGAVTPHY